MSTTSDEQATRIFAGKSGFVLHINNPKELGDFYNLVNISQCRGESEFVTRIPDDILMIPTAITKKGLAHHIEVMCIRSEQMILHNSDAYNKAKDSLNLAIGEITNVLTTSQKKQVEQDVRQLESLMTKIEQGTLSPENKADQEQFLIGFTSALLHLSDLHKSNPIMKEKLDDVNRKYQIFTSAFIDAKSIDNTQEFSKYESTKYTLKNSINKMKSSIDNLQQKNTLLSLEICIDSVAKGVSNHEKREVLEPFLKGFEKQLNRLKESKPPLPKKDLDIIEKKFNDFKSEFGVLKIESYVGNVKLKEQQDLLADQITGISRWYQGVDPVKKASLVSLNSDLQVIMALDSGAPAVKEAVSRVIEEIKINPIENFPHLKERMQDILDVYEKIDSIANPDDVGKLHVKVPQEELPPPSVEEAKQAFKDFKARTQGQLPSEDKVQKEVNSVEEVHQAPGNQFE